MMKELELFKVENYYGFDQSLFSDRWMNIGGCGAVVACDISIYLARRFGLDHVYPFSKDTITASEYIRFSQIMKPYLRPRMTGINTLEVWMDGYRNYLKSVGETRISMKGLNSDCSFETMREALKRQIDSSMAVPYLNLQHHNPNFTNYVWHWFWLAGYEEFEDSFMVKAVTYGTYHWFSFPDLWNSGYTKKGGMILINLLWDR